MRPSFSLCARRILKIRSCLRMPLAPDRSSVRATFVSSVMFFSLSSAMVMFTCAGGNVGGWRIGEDLLQSSGGSVDNVKTSLSRREPMNGAAEPRPDLLKTNVFNVTKSVRPKNRCDASRLETADRKFINFFKLFGPLFFQLP